ncbi:sugar transferase [Clostridium sp. SHJSY1]|nr:sugar transferase [Clostridium sp. SHJSY1]MDS0526659.1 sugar transferase [Clostridium sp. SHJSY1]
MQNAKLSEEELVYEQKYEEISIGYAFVKRLIDVICSFLGIIALSPVFLIVSIAIRIESTGKAIFVQDRVGFEGKEFKMYKFRSMVQDAEDLKDKLKEKNEMNGPMFKIKKDPRVTKVGAFIRKTSIDELPQLINVLKGEMSLVGPRPSLPEEVKEFEPWMMERFSVKPGLTCYWQVSGRNDIGFYEWMELDIKYVKEKGILVDMSLILKTVSVLLGDKHAS